MCDNPNVIVIGLFEFQCMSCKFDPLQRFYNFLLNCHSFSSMPSSAETMQLWLELQDVALGLIYTHVILQILAAHVGRVELRMIHLDYFVYLDNMVSKGGGTPPQ